MANKPQPKESVGVRPRTNRVLEKVCKVRGWSKAEAIDRLVNREWAACEAEKAARAAEPAELAPSH